MICSCVSPGKSKVTFPELLDILLDFKTRNVGNWKDEILAAFQACDDTGSGYIAMKDLKHVLLRTGEKLSMQECEWHQHFSFVLLRSILIYHGLKYFSTKW